MIVHLYNATRISGPYGPLILALAEGWLASLTRGFASLNLSLGLCPPLIPFWWEQKQMQIDKRVGTEVHTNKQMGGDRSTYKQTKGWGRKHIRTNKGVGTEAHTNKTKRWGQRGVNTHTNGKTKSMQLYNDR